MSKRHHHQGVIYAAMCFLNISIVYLLVGPLENLNKEDDVRHGLNAFSAMLSRLQGSCYKEGFIQGLPLDDFPRALLWFHRTPPRRRVRFAAWTWAGWEGEVSEDLVHGAKYSYDAMMPPLRVWKFGEDGHPEPIYNFNPTPHIIKELEDVDDSASSLESSVGSEESGSYEGGYKDIDFTKDPIFRLAKAAPEETLEIPARVDDNHLLIEGIVIRVNYTHVTEEHSSDSEVETDDEYDARRLIQLEGQPQRERIKFYGHHAAQLANQQSNREQEFLLLSREHHGTAQMVYNSLLFIDRNGDTAKRVGVASLRLESVELLDHFNPERRLFTLR